MIKEIHEHLSPIGFVAGTWIAPGVVAVALNNGDGLGMDLGRLIFLSILAPAPSFAALAFVFEARAQQKRPEDGEGIKGPGGPMIANALAFAGVTLAQWLFGFSLFTFVFALTGSASALALSVIFWRRAKA